MLKYYKSIILTFMLQIYFAITLSASTILVPDDQPTIQAGIDDASNGDSVLVSEGMYTGDGNRDINLFGKAVVIISENGSDNTIINCQADSLNPHRAFQFINGEDSTTKVEGFTIINGYGDHGGAIECSYSSPMIEKCIFKNNTGTDITNAGGAISLYFSNSIISKCIIDSNNAIGGGGIYTWDGNPLIKHCLFSNNTASAGGGGIHSHDGAPHIVNCTFVNNSAIYGGGIDYYGANPIIEYCIISNNHAPNGSGIWEGAGNGSIYCSDIYSNSNVRCLETNCFSLNPLFCDTLNANLGISFDSPCSEKNNECGVLIGAFDINCDIPPNIISVSPSQNALNAQTSTSISVAFDVDMDPTTINDTTFIVHARSTGLHMGNYTYDSLSKTATFDPYQDFSVGEIVSVILTSNIKSFVGVSIEKPFLWTFTTEVQGGGGYYTAVTNYPVGEWPMSISAADFNGDYSIDLVNANLTDSLELFLNNGDGLFSAHDYYLADVNPMSVTTGDFNRDGHMDMASANEQANNIAVLLNNGDGLFNSADLYPVSEQPWSIVAADFNGDGYLDIATANQHTPYGVSVLFNNGDGTFDPYLLFTDYSTDEEPKSVFASDIDNDGDIDLVTANGGGAANNMTIIYNNGFGIFDSHIDCAIGGITPWSIYVTDLNKDGYSDVAVANAGSDNVSILINDGYGSFPTYTTFAVGDNPNTIIASDVNNDDNLDLITSQEHSNDISVLLGNGDGTFQPHNDFPVGGILRSICLADYDGDGDLDIAASNLGLQSITIMRNKYPYYGPVWYVSNDGNDLENNGSGEEPFLTIQHAINTAENGDTVLVADGIYTGDGNRDIDFLGKAIVVKSENGPDNTIIDCEGSEYAPHRAVVFHSGEDIASQIIGLTIQGGFGPYDHPISGESQGGGILCSDSSSPKICNCIIKSNISNGLGGGIMCYFSSPTIVNCRFTDNISSNYGGAAALEFSSPLFDSCYFASNIAFTGGGISNYADSPIISSSIFINNYASNRGGAIDTRSASMRLTECLVSANVADRAGGIWIQGANPTLSNCTIVSNISDTEGSGIIFNSSTGVLKNSIVAYNLGGWAGISGGTPSLICCNVYNNEGGDWVGYIADQYGINGNISEDPLFCDITTDNYFLLSSSPCAAENNECGNLIGAYGVGCDDVLEQYGFINESLTNVISHVPNIYWQYIDKLPEDSFEIAIGIDDDWTYSEMWNPASFSGPDTSILYSGAPLFNGETYYMRLRIHNTQEWSIWYDTSFHMNSIPSIPVALGPITNVIVNITQPMLCVMNSSDDELDDTLTYEFIVANDTTFGEPDPIWEDGVAEGIDSTGWQVMEPLNENWQYYWNCRAFDQYEYSDWGDPQYFWVNAIEEAPEDFGAYFPPDTDNAIITDMLTTFWWGETDDPDPLDSVYYTLYIAIDSNFGFVKEIDSIWTIEYTLGMDDSLSFGTRYWWKVKATDNTGRLSYSTNTPDFRTWMLGDVSGDWQVNILDAVFIINYLYKGGSAPNPLVMGDVNGSCTINILDVTFIINYLYKSGPAPVVGCE